MKIRLKTLLALIVTTLCLFMAIHQISATIIENNFSKIEREEVTQTIVRLHIAATSCYTELDSKLTSWSQKNSTYEYIKSQNTSESQTCLSAVEMQALNINYAIFIDKNGVFLTGTGLNLTSLQSMSIPTELINKLSSDEQIWKLEKFESYKTGFIQVDGQPMFLASRPILTSEGAGPARGVLIFARNFDKAEMTKLSFTLRLSLTMQSYNDWKSGGFAQDDVSAASYIKPLNEESIAGYDIINDIYGKPIFVLGAISPRAVYIQGAKTVGFIDQTLIVSGIIFTVTIIAVLEFSVLNRLGKLTVGVKNLGATGKQSQMLTVTGNDEITWLTHSINGLLEKIQSQSLKLQKTERLSAIGELARQVGHDLRNPLTSINNAIYYLKHKGATCTEKDQRTMLTIIESDIQRADKTITRLVEYSSEVLVDPQKCTAKGLVADVLAETMVPNQITVIDKTSLEHILNVDKEKIESVFSAIVKNAVDAMPKGGNLEVESRQIGSNIQITFSDNGVGIPEKLAPKMFTPLMTTKAQGIGFSLAISKRIVEAHGGTITFESQAGKGTIFTVSLSIQPKIDLEKQNVAISKDDPLLHYEDIDEASADAKSD
ncbi:MAG: ATP-binding protein [Candidatus Bathyarchaeia archaeon]|jgi:signal transduction histidine kinase